VLEAEATPEVFQRIENLKELANAAQDAEERGETLSEFLDHAALVSDADSSIQRGGAGDADELHAAKGLEFPLVFLAGMEEGLFPHSRTLNDPNGLEEERRLCYVGMTRAMDTLVMTRAQYRRRYGKRCCRRRALPSRFLEEVPGRLVENLGSDGPRRAAESSGAAGFELSDWGWLRGGWRFWRGHYSYEDEDQSGGRWFAGDAGAG
jgi:DNA helicase-2/ATP-dependent DNA helicase PcrA